MKFSNTQVYIAQWSIDVRLLQLNTCFCLQRFRSSLLSSTLFYFTHIFIYNDLFHYRWTGKKAMDTYYSTNLMASGLNTNDVQNKKVAIKNLLSTLPLCDIRSALDYEDSVSIHWIVGHERRSNGRMLVSHLFWRLQ
jgi:hypothetical protein